jgi:hypothetical protein
MAMTLEDAVRIAQIAFYAVIATVTVLTFLRAKSTLLSPINTEYHKKVIDRLDTLSKQLLDEFDRESDNFWGKGDPIGTAVGEIIERFNKHKEAILAAGEFPGTPSHPDYDRLDTFVQRIKSDPFIPAVIRDEITDLLESRANTILELHLTELEEYKAELATGKREPKEHDAAIIHNKINKQLYERGCGISQIEDEVHQIRKSVQQYLERFNPAA